MFISKKRFNEAIENAKCETEKRILENERINRMQDAMYRRFSDLEKRIWLLEHPNAEAVNPDTPKPIGY